MPLDDIQYHALLLRSRELRRLVDELGSLTGPVIEASVDARLQKKPQAELPSGQKKLVDEIVGILENPGLSSIQARGVAHAFRSK